jgi:hypothetical protein
VYLFKFHFRPDALLRALAHRIGFRQSDCEQTSKAPLLLAIMVIPQDSVKVFIRTSAELVASDTSPVQQKRTTASPELTNKAAKAMIEPTG